MSIKIRSTISILLLFLILYQPSAYAEDYTRWGLPKGAKMRIGKGEISANIEFSPDSSHLAVSSSIGIWIYDVHTGKELALLDIHEGYTTSVAFSPDGKTIVCSSANDLYIWELETGNLKYKVQAHAKDISSIEFLTNGNTLATRGRGGDQIKFWDVSTGTLEKTFAIQENNVNYITFSPDGKLLASVFHLDSDKVNIRDVSTGTILTTIDMIDANDIEKVVFSPDGNTIAIQGGWLDSIIHLWDVTTDMHNSLRGHAEGIKTMAFSPDGKTLASGGDDETIILWDVATQSYKKTLIEHTDFVVSIAFSPDGKTLVSGSRDGTIILWDTDSFLQIGRITGHAYGFRSIAFSPSGDKIVTGSYDTTVRVWNTNTGENTITFLGHIADVQTVAFSPDGKTIASGAGSSLDNAWFADDYTVRLWDVTTQTQKAVLLGHHSTVYHVTFSPDGSLVASCGWEGKAIFWDTETGHPIWTINGDRGELKAQNEKRKSIGGLTFSPDGQRVANGDSTGIYVWDFASRQQIGTYTGMTIEDPLSVFSPNCNTLTVILENNDVRLWNIPANERTQNLLPHTTNFVRFGNNPEEYTPITAGYWENDKIKLMDPIEGEAAITLQTKPDEVDVIAFSPDGNTLATASSGGTILLWDVKSITDPSHQIADLNNDGREGMHDVMIIAENFGKTGYNVADVNKDGIVNIEDLIRAIGTFRNPDAVLDAVRQGKDIAPTRETAKTWLYKVLHLEKTDYISQLGVQFLKELIVALYPLQTALLPNYPNPFNPETWIPYQLARSADVSIRIYSAEGRLIRTLKFGHQPVGLYLDQEKAAYWNGENELGETVASGVYFYTLTAGQFTATRKMLIRK